MEAETNKMVITKFNQNQVITNQEGKEDLHVYLPPPNHGYQYSIIQLSDHLIFLHTNASDVSFLCKDNPKTLIVSSEDAAFGRTLTICSFQGKHWRIASTTFLESHLLFED